MPARVTTANKQDVLDFIAAILDEGQYQVVLPGGTEEIRIVPVRGAPPPTVTPGTRLLP